MAVKKRKSQPPGVPEWVVTFGDMMSLLLCFFVLLQMFSELKKDEQYQHVVTAIKEAFGYAGTVGVMPIDDPPLRSVIEVLEQIALDQAKQHKSGTAQDDGMTGPTARVTTVRDGVVFTIGGTSAFDELSAEIKAPVRAELERLTVLLKGRRNKIVVRGHASPKYLPEGSQWTDLDELSFARARNVKDVLVEFGLEDDVFRIEAVGTREPVAPRAVDPTKASENRRVEIILTEQLVEEMNVDAQGTDPDRARGA